MPNPLTQHLRNWVGQWPPSPGITVIGHPARDKPGWDGERRPLQGVSDGVGTVIAVPPSAADEVGRVLGTDLTDPGLGARLAPVLGMSGAMFGTGVFRWTHLPAPLAPVGTWATADDGRLPPWLAPFNGRRLVTWDHVGRYIAGLGIKVHDDFGQEIAVVTTPAARGKGLARRLVVTAARRVLAEGGVPTYLHDEANHASARVADAAGFPDRGWRIHGLWGR
ncbi:MAG: GNAT family N-acetyltransferase [Euzebya sp.]